MKMIQRWKFGRGDRVALGLGLGLVMMLALSGCVGYVDGGGVAVVAPDPEVTVFGGGYYGAHDAHWFSHRGYESRGAAHGWHH